MKTPGSFLDTVLDRAVWLLPVIAVLGGAWLVWNGEKSNAAILAATMIGIWVAVLTSLLATRTAQHVMLVELLRALQVPNTLKAMAAIGIWYDEEREKQRSKTWTLADHVGIRYLTAVQSDAELHASRREATAVYETVCSLIMDGTVSERLALGIFPNLRQRAATFTAVEEFLSLAVTARRFHNRNDELQRLWNQSRTEEEPSEATIDIGVGKRSMRRFSGLHLLVHSTETKVDYAGKILHLAVSDLASVPSHGETK